MATGLFTLKQQVLAIREGGWPGQKPLAVDYLVVAGGGGGGSYGGGGAGGLLQGNIGITQGSSITVTVGGGGSGSALGNTGSNSVFGSVTASGGGGGGGGAEPDDGTGGAAFGTGGGGGGLASSAFCKLNHCGQVGALPPPPREHFEYPNGRPILNAKYARRK